MSGSGSKRRGPPAAAAANPLKRFQPGNGGAGNDNSQSPNPIPIEDEMMDEDVFLEETLIKYEEDEEALILLRDEGLASRLSKWKRPNLSPSHLSQSQSIVFQQLEIDYIIGNSDKELLPILRIFGVTKEVCVAMFTDSSPISTSAVLRGWGLMIYRGSSKP